jgi:ABC-2 type transport system permease protein
MTRLRRLSLLRSELRLARRSLLLWALSIAALVALVVSVYPSIRNQSSLNSIYGDLSPAAQTLLGGSDLTSATGYLSTQLFAFFLPAVLLVFAIGRGAGTIAGEEEHHTLDLLLAQPMRRQSLYLQKAASVLTGIVLLTAATWGPLVALDSAVGFGLPVAHLAGICLQMGLFCAALALCAQAIAATTGRRVIGVAITTAYAATSYVVYGISASVHWLADLRPVTLWRWYLSNDPLSAGAGAAEITTLCAVCFIALVVGVSGLERRDLRA